MNGSLKETTFKTTTGKTYIFRASRILSREECIEHLRQLTKKDRAKKNQTVIIYMND